MDERCSMFLSGRYGAKENGFICLKSRTNWTSRQTNPSRGQKLFFGIVGHNPYPFMTAAITDRQSFMGGETNDVVGVVADVTHKIAPRCTMARIENLTAFIGVVRHSIHLLPG